MARNPKQTVKSLPGLIFTGTLACIITTLLLTALLAKIVASGSIEESRARYYIIGILFLASFTGGIVGIKALDKQKLPVCLGIGAIYALILLATTILFFDSRFNGVLPSVFLILCGSVTALLVKMEGRGSGKRRKPKYRNR